MNERPITDGARSGKDVPGGDPPRTTERAGAALICVVDDDESVRDSFRALLESLGFAVTTYASGRDMFGDERRHQASCFIVDQHMPEMDGLATLGALRREGSSVQMILMTGRLDPEIAARATMLEIGAVLEKPLSVTLLLELIRAPGPPSR
jgi:two-component system, LuxR family, response regulator FixJ